MTKTVCIATCENEHGDPMRIFPGDIYFVDLFDHILSKVTGMSLVAVYNTNKNLIGYTNLMHFQQVRHR